MTHSRNFRSLALFILFTVVGQNYGFSAEFHDGDPASTTQSLAATSGYNTQVLNKNCDGFPQVPLTSQNGICVGLVASRVHGLKQPRYAAQYDEKTLLVTEMDGWAVKTGTVWAIEFNKRLEDIGPGEFLKTRAINLFPKNNLPNPAGIAVDPKGNVYVGLMTGIYKFSLSKKISGEFNNGPQLNPFINDFDKVRGFTKLITAAEDFAHPLINFAFSTDFKYIYVNFGSKTDSCLGNKSMGASGKENCNENSGEFPFASVRRYSMDDNFELIPNSGITFAKGLRNSMALAVHSSGLLVQGENSRDLSDSEQPAEEINILKLSHENTPRHYGWPYCFNDGNSVVTSPEFITRKEECQSSLFVPPHMALPAHSAPLGMLYPSGKKMHALKSNLLVSLHGYAKSGHRIISIPMNQNGEPEVTGEMKEVVTNWGSSPHLNPLGAPTGLLEWSDGSILIMDDKNGAILRMSDGQAINKTNYVASGSSIKITEEMVEAFTFSNKILNNKCSACHSDISSDPRKTLQGLIDSGKLNPADLEESSLLMKIRYNEMPPKTANKNTFPPLTPNEKKLLLKDLLRVF